MDAAEGQLAQGGDQRPNGAEPEWLSRPPEPGTGVADELPERAGYRVKRLLLGPPLVSESLHTERLGRPTALAVLSSDVMSSCAYATESILTILVPVIGLAAFSLITPVTLLILVVLGVICLCYRQVVRAYPVSGGSYVVSRENFGYSTAQIPGAALLCSYTLTVAVSIAAGVDAVISAFPSLAPYPVELSVVFVVLLAYGNLRGIREAGRVFAVPTYWFLASMALVIVAGLVQYAAGTLPKFPAHHAGYIPVGARGGGLLLGASLFIFLRAFANGGSAMTGMEAISNAVTVFKEPQVRNARSTLVTMALILGAMFLGVSVLAALTHAVPYASGTPTVLSEIGKQVFGTGVGSVAYYSLQFSTALILILGANTSFNGFPLLVSFIAQDAYLPKPLTTRGHRLVYSNGVLLLAFASIVLLLVTGARVQSLIPLYATTVFTGFTMAGAGMLRYHLRHPGPAQRSGIVINATAFGASLIVTLIFLITEFTRGAWAVAVAIPAIVLVLTRTHHRYQEEKVALAEDTIVQDDGAARALRRHTVLVLVDRVDLATSRAFQLARSIAASGDLRAVHFALDEDRARKLAEQWAQLGVGNVALEVMECPDRRLVRAVTELAAELASGGETEVTLILPRRVYRGVASRLLHDYTADRIVSAVGQIPNVSATVAPYDVEGMLRRRWEEARPAPGAAGVGAAVGAPSGSGPAGEGRRQQGREQRRTAATTTRRVPMVEGATPIADLTYRQRARVAGRVRAMRVQPWSGVPTLECTLVDGTG
ncbi:MAG TPA: APC family permease, partial [Acidimicrobiales bacterium]|nr:APC family permease [Acidimicrobiales bacterium]